MAQLFSNVGNLTWQQAVMWLIGGILIYLAVKRDMEPALLLPMGFGAILVNLPLSGAVTQIVDGVEEIGVLNVLFDAGIANELFPLLLFIGIGAMIDFGPLLADPKLLLFGAAAQFGIFFTLSMASLFGFELRDAASIAIIGAADGPTSIFVAQHFKTQYIGAIIVAAYSYMALVPIIQPPIMRALTTPADRCIRMEQMRQVGKVEKIVFPLVVLGLCVVLLPSAAPLIGFFMFGNLMRECGVVERLSSTAQNALLNIVTIFLGLGVGAQMSTEKFLTPSTLGILFLGAIAFSIGTAAGVLMARIMNLFPGARINPLIGSAGVSAMPMAARVSHRLGMEADPENMLLMHAMGPNVAGVIGSAVAAGVLLTLKDFVG